MREDGRLNSHRVRIRAASLRGGVRRQKPVELKSTLIELEWVNPHAWIHMEVKDETGKVTKWDCELGSPNLLMRSGWRRDSLKKGDVIIVNGSAARMGRTWPMQRP